jgi:hypothetical protein
MKQFLREYRIELVAVLMALLGIFLLVERMQIRVTILRIILLAWRTLSGTVGAVVREVIYRILHITVSDLIGLVLLVLSIVIVLWRVRMRVLQRLTGSACPVCGGELRRSRRDWMDRLLSLLLPVAPYRCRNEECRWEGLRVRRRR